MATKKVQAQKVVELTGLEPVTPALPVRCATSCATAPRGSPRTAMVRRPPYTKAQVIPDAGSGQWFAPLSASSNHRLVLVSGTILPFTSAVGVPKRWSDRRPLM